MPPNIATLLYAIVIVGLFRFDRDKKKRTSLALWIPTLWLFFCLSRSTSQWLGISASPADAATSYAEGSPLDAAVYQVLEIAALIVLIGRRRRVGPILLNNWAIWLFFSYAAFSVFWSDYSFVTFKHWIKGIGDMMMVLIVLTEPSISDAIGRMFTRLGFVLLPLSILFIKYYPLQGRVLTLSWTMEPVGVATQKNSLGELCDIIGLALLWRLRSAYNDRENPNRRTRLLALGTALAMVIWLLSTCNSMTSMCALGMASTLMLISTRPALRRRPVLLHLFVVGLLASTIYALFFQSSGSLIENLGRNPTLTGRTEVWHAVFNIPNNLLVGAGYESFWLGSRLQEMWQALPGFRINEAHNGYIEIILTLGWIGEILLGILIATGYRNVILAYRRDPDIGSLRLAFFIATIITALTEAAFRMMGPPWILFLLATTAVPAYTARQTGRHERIGRRLLPSAAEPEIVGEEALIGC